MVNPPHHLAAALLLVLACTGDPAPGATEATSTASDTATGTTAASTTAASTTSTASTASTSTGSTTNAGSTSADTTTATTATTDTTTGGQPACPPPGPPPGAWTSERVPLGDDGYLAYPADPEGNHVPDFGAAGYRRGAAPPPDLPIVVEVAPSGADDTAAIQAAIDQAGALPLDPEGHRGAVLLAPGTYTIAGTIALRHSGVVLRGAGDGDDPATATILRAVGDTPHQRDVIVAGSGVNDRWKPEVPGTRTDVVTDLVSIGARALEVAAPENFAVGDHVVIVHPCTAAWLAAVDHGATAADDPWTVGSQPLVFKRQITAIAGAALTFDAPLFNRLDRKLAQSYVYLADRADVVTEVGVEDLRIDIVTKGGDDENHAWSAIALRGVEDSWVRSITALHFGYAGVTVETGVQITVDDVRALDPVAQLTGGRMYNFDVSGGQQILFTRCRARGGRHHYVSNGTSWTAGVVFHRSVSEGAHAPSEGHRRWSMGLLYDNHREENPATTEVLGLYNRGDHGTGHGWASVHSLAWNVDLGAAIGLIQRPPTAQNYAIGGAGEFSGATPPAPFKHPEGHIEGIGEPGLFPESLYERQLAERLCGR